MERTVRLTTTGFYDVSVPAAPERGTRLPLLIALHGYGGTKESILAVARRIVGADCVIAALQGTQQMMNRRRGLSPRPGFGWGTMHNAEANQRLHHDFVRAVLADLRRRGPADPTRVFLLGFSQSVALNYRFAFTYPNVIRGVIAVCGGIPGDWETSGRYRRSATHILHISGTKDPFYPLARVRTYGAALARRARSVEHRFLPVGHRFPRRSLPMIRRWLLEKASSG